MLEGLTPPEKEQLCVLMRKAADLDPADTKILIDAVADPRWNGAALHRALEQRGFKVHKDAINKHRNKACGCAW